MMKAKFTVFLLLLQRLWMLSLGQTIIVSKGSNNAHHKLSSKHILKQPSLPDIVTGEKKEALFPEVYYPESILDLNQPMYYNQEAFEIKQSGSYKDSGDILLKTAAPIFGNYKRKQRLRALNDLYKKVNNTVVNDFKFDDDDRKQHHDETQQRGIKWRDQVYINKILAKEPYVNTLVKEKPESKISIANTKDIFKYTASTLQTKSNQTVFNDNPLMDNQMQLIVADLIDITEQIFDSVLVYISDNHTIENLSGDEIVEIIQVVENLNKVLDILEYLSTNFMSSKVQNENDQKILVISEFTASPSEAETVLPDINEKNPTGLSLTEVVDGAILKVDSILNNTFPTLDNCSGEISKATYEMVNSLKQILVVMEELNTNVSSSSDFKSSKSADISGDLTDVDVSDVTETTIDGKYGNISTIFVQEETDPTERKDVLTQSNLNSSLHNIENVTSNEMRNNISIKDV